jgi:lipopolysaccharide/colanic/teichoic acid biosynthesis glycosyltransferase
LVVLSPVLLVLAILVKMSDGGPVLFCQERVGKAGRRFSILKFRSMVTNAEHLGPGITKDGDPRITRIGRFLRKSKLDELPQLWNVLRGEMSFVGPRPEIPYYVEKYTTEQKKVLAFQPGITDLATLEFRNEEELLSKALSRAKPNAEAAKPSANEMEEFYIKFCVPRKIQLNLDYARRASVWEDTKLILRTVWALGVKRRAQEPSGR